MEFVNNRLNNNHKTKCKISRYALAENIHVLSLYRARARFLPNRQRFDNNLESPRASPFQTRNTVLHAPTPYPFRYPHGWACDLSDVRMETDFASNAVETHI
jgi:hypothetical protein